MGGIGNLFKKPKAPKIEAPKPVAPPAIVDTQQAGDEAVRRARRKKGFQGTLLTGALSPGRSNL